MSEMRDSLSRRDLAYCGLFGAAALLLPALFHLVHLGRVFMPMYLPLLTLAFFVRPLPAAVTSFLSPLLSGAVTGMPPFYPPIALFMAIELSAMSALVAVVITLFPRVSTLLVLIPVLLAGCVLYVALVYGCSLLIEPPAGFMAGLSFVSGWPGILLMLARIIHHSRGGSLVLRYHSAFASLTNTGSIRSVAENTLITNTCAIHPLSGELSRLVVIPIVVRTARTANDPRNQWKRKDR